MARRRRQVEDDAPRFDAPVGDEKPAAPPLEGEGYDDWLTPTEAPIEAEVTEPVVAPEEVNTAPEEPKSRNYGNWVFTPWRGRDMWKNVKSGRTSFDEQAVRRYRHMDDVSSTKRPKK